MNNKDKGRAGELLALEFLKNKNYKILEVSFQNRYGEIDIICENEEYIVFVEVKYRKNLNFGNPLESIDIKKQNKIYNTALYYISDNQIKNKNFRFDCIGILGDKDISHIENAF